MIVLPVAALAANSSLLAGSAGLRAHSRASPSTSEETTGTPAPRARRTSHRKTMTLAALDARLSAPRHRGPVKTADGLPLALDPSRWIVTDEALRARLEDLKAKAMDAETSPMIEVHHETLDGRLHIVRSVTLL